MHMHTPGPSESDTEIFSERTKEIICIGYILSVSKGKKKKKKKVVIDKGSSSCTPVFEIRSYIILHESMVLVFYNF